MNIEATVDRRVMRGCIVVALLGIAMFAGGLVIMGFIPPPSPSASTAEIAHLWQSNSSNIRMGVVLAVIGTTLSTGYPAVLSALVRRCEGQNSPLTYFQVQLGAINYTFAGVLMAVVGAVALRDRAPETYQFWMDVLWLLLIGVPFLGDVQMVVVAVAAFRDRSQTVFPRWYAWYSLWQAFITAPAGVVFFMPKGGMFGWNGGVSFYFIVPMFFIWVCITARVLWSSAGRIGGVTVDRAAQPFGSCTPTVGTVDTPHSAQSRMAAQGDSVQLEQKEAQAMPRSVSREFRRCR
ncbi:hypothetical protein FZI91_06845 [Mycobacterium sp. CBMA271]|uniref:hypothetical protein n=1 Tax=unclassified Mycobacteroides TaxID=2618759 RepID=UPI0012DC3209|nr:MULTISPECIES: hypothetical protein [unclassified Mycobacteroides]MUM19451.1 hypothetical protein [Mycobacteroides sp. CBMA 326]MUM21422.1 hypothetical protein [Mycobacteroides sp. CBMA 271]